MALARKSKQEFLMKDFRLAALSVNVMWNFSTILMLDKSFIGSCTFCTAEVESVEAEGVIRLTGGRPPGRQPSWTTGDELEITERMTTVLNIIVIKCNTN
jgi:hypothetical protein